MTVAVKPYRASEAECRKTILEAARVYGWRIHCPRTARTAAGAHLTADDGDPGWPDIFLTRGFRALAVELKRHPNKLEPEQVVWLEQLGNIPGITVMVVWVPEQMEQFIRALASKKPVNDSNQSTLLQFACADWVRANVDESPDIFRRITKAAEELGEFARAVGGEYEKRPNRGDPIQEAAQLVVVLLSIFGEFYPYADLYGEVQAELDRLNR